MVRQLSVFIQNKSGKIASVTRTLYQNGIDIRALSVADTADFGILRMLVSDVEKARTALANENCIVSVNEVDVVAVPDRPGGTAEVLQRLAEANIDIEYMYSLIDRGTSDAYMVFRLSDEANTNNVLEELGLKTVPGKMLGLN
ncbi:MAG: ACT domain-containing protein [Ruminococcaceae bacterium]|nr:ACT domain-containing protein [Oscillospiraceae bacterium]